MREESNSFSDAKWTSLQNLADDFSISLIHLEKVEGY